VVAQDTLWERMQSILTVWEWKTRRMATAPIPLSICINVRLACCWVGQSTYVGWQSVSIFNSWHCDRGHNSALCSLQQRLNCLQRILDPCHRGVFASN
jgi:hypothetical protein